MKNNKLAAYILGALVVMGFASIVLGTTTPDTAEALATMAGIALI